MKNKHQLILAGFLILATLIWAGWRIWQVKKAQRPTVSQKSSQIHVHSDFALYINGSKVDLTADKYQSTTYDPKHLTFHLHDGVDTMLHRHADGVTLGEFLNSIDFTLTNECLTNDSREEYCANEEKVLRLYVNGETIGNPAEYITQEEDRILLYFGNDNFEQIQQLNESITDEACIYSGNCPERGDPPYESCALTCEV